MLFTPDDYVHPYLGLTPKERGEMMRYLGIESVDQLFSDVPAGRDSFDKIPDAATEQDVFTKLLSLSTQNATPPSWHSFLGGRVRQRYIPSVVQKIVDRGELLTSYTPYQPEISQGMLQALFEYQSLIAELCGLDVVNCSHYTQGTSLGEAAHMANRVNGRSKIVVCGPVHPERLEVLRTYCRSKGLSLHTTGWDSVTGGVDLEASEAAVDADTSLVYAESPNYFGVVDSAIPELSAAAHVNGSLFCMGFDLISLSLFTTPGECDADIAVGEGVGIPMSYGGPGVGIFATRSELARKAPGRLVGATRDASGRRGFVITLQTREQHIRREKATSNITTNSAILAVANAVYLALLGPDGLKDVAKRILENRRLVIGEIEKAGLGNTEVFKGFTFQDHVVEFALKPEKLAEAATAKMVLGPTHLDRVGLTGKWLVGVSETTTKGDVEALVSALEDARSEV
ncbi:MAG: aminomethyl-transferring glycine dehydrogenase subunit GcvPA [Candidatus Marsarchaeota archaeon]|nr:aminomethyl-transferring glycine dehydrogenase subunit GcvPA [Candidatus Marsarchaeota archaeon]